MGAWNEPLVVVTSESHVSPRLEEDLLPFCPKMYRCDSADWMDATVEMRKASEQGRVSGGDEGLPEVLRIHTWNLQTTGQGDIHERLREVKVETAAANG